MTNRFKQSQKEIQEWKKSYEEEHIKNETNVQKFNMYEDSLNALREKCEEAQAQVKTEFSFHLLIYIFFPRIFQ